MVVRGKVFSVFTANQFLRVWLGNDDAKLFSCDLVDEDLDFCYYGMKTAEINSRQSSILYKSISQLVSDKDTQCLKLREIALTGKRAALLVYKSEGVMKLTIETTNESE